MSDPITPSHVENLPSIQHVNARIQNMHASRVAQHSTAARSVYWSKAMGTWIFVTRNGSGFRVAYFQMEDCPCNKGK